MRTSWRCCLVSRCLIVPAACLWCVAASAQYTANRKTNTISAVTSNWVGIYELGATNFGDVLIITNRGVLNDASGYLGFTTGGSNNLAIVTGSVSSGATAPLSISATALAPGTS